MQRIRWPCQCWSTIYRSI